MPKYLDQTGLAHFWDTVNEAMTTIKLNSRELLLNKLGVIEQRTIEAAGYTSNCQGFCVHGDYMYTIWRNPSTEVGYLEKRNKKTGALIGSGTISNVGHANSMCYDLANDQLCLVTGFNSSANMYSIIKIDPDTLASTGIFDWSSTAYVNDQYIRIGYNQSDGYVYVIGYTSFLKIDMSSETILGETALTYPDGYVQRDVTQGGCAYDDYVGIVLNDSNTIMFFDKSTGAYSHCFHVGMWQGGNTFPEFEDACIVDNTIYINCGGFGLCFYYHAPLDGAGYVNNQGEPLLAPLEGSKHYYVDVNTANPYTADGTQSKPFAYIQQAILASANPENIYTTITVAPGTYRETLFIKNQTVFIQGVNQQSIISAIYAVGSDVTLQSIDFYGTVDARLHTTDTDVTASIAADSCSLTLYNCHATDHSDTTYTYYPVYATNNSRVLVRPVNKTASSLFFNASRACYVSGSLDFEGVGSGRNYIIGNKKGQVSASAMSIGDTLTFPVAPVYDVVAAISGVEYNKATACVADTFGTLSDVTVIIPVGTAPLVVAFAIGNGSLKYTRCKNLLTGASVTQAINFYVSF